MDELALIAEIQKRPYLWHSLNGRSKRVIKLWKEVAEAVGANVRKCKCKWTQLRQTYYSEERDSRQRIEYLINNGKYNHKQNYDSRWRYFQQMKFLSTITEDNKFSESDSDYRSNFSNTANNDEDFEIELLIEDSPSEWENDNEKNYSLNKGGNKPAYSKNQKLLGKTDSCRHDNKNTLSSYDKISQRNVQFQNISKIDIKQEPHFQHNNTIGYPVSSKESKGANEKECVAQNFPKLAIVTIPIHNQVAASERSNYDVLMTAAAIKQEPDVETNTENADKYNRQKCTEDCLRLPSSISLHLIDKSSRPEQSPIHSNVVTLNLLRGPRDEEDVRKASTTSNTNESTNKTSSTNNESTKDLQVYNMDVVRIKEEPVDNDESNSPPESINTDTMSNKRDNKCLKENSPNLPSPKRLRFADANLTPTQNHTPINAETPKCSISLRTREAQDSLAKPQENITQHRTTIEFCDLDCHFLVSFLSHMKSMSQLQNLKFRAKMSNLMLTISSSGNPSEQYTVNTLKTQEQSSLLRALIDIGDSDGNFLASFLPHLQSMSQLQNLQFRAKMSDLILNIFST